MITKQYTVVSAILALLALFALAGCGGGSDSNSSGGGPPPPQSGGITLTATMGSSSNVLSWNAPTHATVTGYDVARAASPAGPFTTPLATGLTQTTYTDSAPLSGGSYYRVTAHTSSLSSGDIVSNVAQAVAASVALTATPGTGNNCITLSWTTTGAAPTSYDIGRAAVTGGPYTPIVTQIHGSRAVDTGTSGAPLARKTTYFYQITAHTPAGDLTSNESSATTFDLPFATGISDPPSTTAPDVSFAGATFSLTTSQSDPGSLGNDLKIDITPGTGIVFTPSSLKSIQVENTILDAAVLDANNAVTVDPATGHLLFDSFTAGIGENGPFPGQPVTSGGLYTIIVTLDTGKQLELTGLAGGAGAGVQQNTFTDTTSHIYHFDITSNQ